MYWRLTNREYEDNKGSKNREKLHTLVKKGRPLGVLAFDRDIPVGWCSISPRKSLVRLQNSRLFKKIDEKSVWSISCLFIKKEYRREGLSAKLIHAAVNYAFEEGATIIEAYPIIPKEKTMPDSFSWVGFVKPFRKAGFKEVSRPSETRVFMRLEKQIL